MRFSSSRKRGLLLIGVLIAGNASIRSASPSTPPPQRSQAGVSQPVVLGLQELKPYTAACVEHQAQISKEFGVSRIDFNFGDGSKPEDAYGPRCQAFAFPGGYTLFAFDTLGVTGAVVFKTATLDIVTILPWSRILRTQSAKYDEENRLQPRPDEELYFDRTFYRVREVSDVWGVPQWNVTALVFAIFAKGGDMHDVRYETWEFSYAANSRGGFSGGSTRRYSMVPDRTEMTR